MKKFLSLFVFSLSLSVAAANADQPLDHGTFARSCAPWDGAAVGFEITGADGGYPHIGFSLFTGEDKVKTGSYAAPMASHDGNINYCTGPNGCQLVDKGEVRLLEFDPWKTARISYDLTLKDGAVLKGEAHLTGSDASPFCG